MNVTDIQITRHLDEHLWRQFVEEHPQGSIFHTPEMFQVFAQAKGHRPSLWTATDAGKQILALLAPVQVTLMSGPAKRLTTRAVAYGGVLCDPGPRGQEALSMLLELYRREESKSALFTELRNLADVTGLQPVLNKCGFIYEDHLNFLVSLDRPPDEILQGIGKRTRKKIRQALRQQEVVIEEAHGPEQVAACYMLLKESYTAAQVPLADRSLFESAFRVLHPRGMAKFLLARIGEHYVASSVELLFKETIYGWYGGMDRAYGDYIPNELLLWHIFSWGAENGYKVYDFGGAGRPDEEYGVRDFKAKFGGTLVCYGRNVFVHTPVLYTISQKGYSVFQKLQRAKQRLVP